MKERIPFSSHLSPEFLLLGLLAISPSHGYDLHRQIETDLRYVWRLSLSQVYNVLSRMEKQGLIEGEIQEQEERPDRKRFQLTTDGEERFQTWMDTPVRASAHAVRIAFLSKLYFGLHLPETDLLTLVEQQRSTIEDGLTRSQIRLDELSNANKILTESLRLRIMQLETLLTWLEKCRQNLIPQ
jgi:DNA-binding PadR family transcriptional regulator